jgi:hypothetical protein
MCHAHTDEANLIRSNKRGFMKVLFRRYYIALNGTKNGSYMDWISLGENQTVTLSYHSIRNEYSLCLAVGPSITFLSHDDAISFLIGLRLA